MNRPHAVDFTHSIQGQILRRSERREVAIFLRDRALWVADFIDGERLESTIRDAAPRSPDQLLATSHLGLSCEARHEHSCPMLRSVLQLMTDWSVWQDSDARFARSLHTASVDPRSDGPAIGDAYNRSASVISLRLASSVA